MQFAECRFLWKLKMSFYCAFYLNRNFVLIGFLISGKIEFVFPLYVRRSSTRFYVLKFVGIFQQSWDLKKKRKIEICNDFSNTLQHFIKSQTAILRKFL